MICSVARSSSSSSSFKQFVPVVGASHLHTAFGPRACLQPGIDTSTTSWPFKKPPPSASFASSSSRRSLFHSETSTTSMRPQGRLRRGQLLVMPIRSRCENDHHPKASRIASSIVTQPPSSIVSNNTTRIPAQFLHQNYTTKRFFSNCDDCSGCDPPDGKTSSLLTEAEKDQGILRHLHDPQKIPNEIIQAFSERGVPFFSMFGPLQEKHRKRLFYLSTVNLGTKFANAVDSSARTTSGNSSTSIGTSGGFHPGGRGDGDGDASSTGMKVSMTVGGGAEAEDQTQGPAAHLPHPGKNSVQLSAPDPVQAPPPSIPPKKVSSCRVEEMWIQCKDCGIQKKVETPKDFFDKSRNQLGQAVLAICPSCCVLVKEH
ncbi:unnamed protein product [Amoebophrya sp. A120]|nr:unnamed protein product [Amoebophrya sp. A120]|eukprot:GSA120T00001214001.1